MFTSFHVDIPRVSQGEELTADMYNMLVDAVNDLRRKADPPPPPPGPMLGELTNDMPIENGASFEWLGADGTIAEGTDPFTLASGVIRRVRNNASYPILRDERHLLFFNEELGHWNPLPGFKMVIGKLTQTLSFEGSATFDVWWRGPTGFAVTDPLITDTCYDWLLKQSGDSIASGNKVICGYLEHAKLFLVLAAEC